MFHGCIVALVTPFRSNGDVDFKRLDELIDFHLAQGTDAISPCGTTGESPTLSHAEHEAVIEGVVKRVRGRVPVIAGTGSNSTSEAIRLTRFAEKVGADGALLVSPYYNKPEPEGMYQHYAAIARAVGIPLVLYNVPGRTGRAIEPTTVAKLSTIKNIVAVKDASGDLDVASEIRSLCDITILSGDDSRTLPLMAVGGKGVISVVANIVPRDVKKMIAAFDRGDTAGAERVHRRLFPLCKAMFYESNPIPVKTAMKMLGRLNGVMRLPLSKMSAGKARMLRGELKKYGLMKGTKR
ncbi:MAG: 4-hydroxy-tetrahydrodipicolinate synthase [Planctomycetes bacterium]|nr:4-hydroxy-tetrahydrodipicolinate synthase [Planctomycetota bacterium]